MISEANKTAIEAVRLSFIIGGRIPQIPYHVDRWRKDHPDTDIADGHVFVEPWPAHEKNKQLRDHVVYSAERAKRTRSRPHKRTSLALSEPNDSI